MNRYKKSRLVVVSSVVLLLSFSFLFVTVQKKWKVPYVTTAVQELVSSAQTLFSRPVQFFSEKKDFFVDLLQTYEENQELKASLFSLENALEERNTLKEENRALQANLEMKQTYADKTLLSAMVSLRNPITWTDEIVIDMGLAEGVTTEMLVMANGGLIGLVKEVGEHTAVVKLLSTSDEVSKVAVKIATPTTTLYGILTGYDTDKKAFIVTQLNSMEEIPAGSRVVTSDLAGNTPSNLLVGETLLLETSSSNLTQTLYVTPAADFSNLYAVLVVGE